MNDKNIDEYQKLRRFRDTYTARLAELPQSRQRARTTTQDVIDMIDRRIARLPQNDEQKVEART